MSADDFFRHQQRYALNQENFDQLLAWLNADRELAGKKYEEIRARLIRIFVHRGCTIAEELADETINRVAGKMSEIENNYIGEKEKYFYGVAGNVFLEYTRARPPRVLPSPDPAATNENNFRCLEECLQKLPQENQHLILQYFTDERRAKIDNRKALADRYGVSLNTLRTRAYRIKSDLQNCVLRCVDRQEREFSVMK